MQQLQQRRQQLQQAAEQQAQQPNGGQPGRVGQPQPLGPASQPMAGEAVGGSAPAPGGQGTLGEPSGSSTPQAPVGSRVQYGGNLPTPTGAARTVAQAPATLTLPEAIKLGIDNNLTTLLATERASQARALRQQVRSFLLPNLSGMAYQQNRTLNLAALGLTSGGDQSSMSGSGGTGGGMGGGTGGGGAAPSIPSFVGPFNTFDARLYFSQALLDIASLRQLKSNTAAVQAADLGAQLAREQVATFVALAYLNAQRGNLDVRAARADLALAEALRRLAQQQRDAGVANGIDVVRAQTRASQQRLRVVQAEAAFTQDRLDLERAIGLPQGSATQLVDTLGLRPEPVPTVSEALPAAQNARLETRIAEQTIQQRALDRRSRSAARLPVVAAAADYGASGSTPWQNDRATRTYGVTLSVPVFDGGYIRGRENQARSQERQAELELGNTRGQVEQDVRNALLAWNLATEQVRSADEQLDLAGHELALATQRFRAGVADNLEVLQAQAGLANARALRVQALAQYGAARLNYAAATGAAQSFRL
jgi:outer membrane protein TolC